MIDEKKTDEKVVQEKTRGDRGIVGVASTSDQIKKLWQAAQPIRLSLKRFARQLLTDKEQSSIPKEWFANKSGAKNEERSEKNRARVLIEAQASRAARRKAGASKQSKPKEAASA
jgi:hypothetical protein